MCQKRKKFQNHSGKSEKRVRIGRCISYLFIYFFSLRIKLSEMSKLAAILLVILSLRAHHLPLGQ